MKFALACEIIQLFVYVCIGYICCYYMHGLISLLMCRGGVDLEFHCFLIDWITTLTVIVIGKIANTLHQCAHTCSLCPIVMTSPKNLGRKVAQVFFLNSLGQYLIVKSSGQVDSARICALPYYFRTLFCHIVKYFNYVDFIDTFMMHILYY